MDAAPTRAVRRAERAQASRRRTRTLIGAGVGLLVLAIAAVAFVALSGDGGSSHTASNPATTGAPKTTIDLPVGDVWTESAGASFALSSDQTQAVVTTLRTYVQVGLVAPLRTGQPAGDLSGAFDSSMLARVNGDDRATMLDEGLPKVTGDLSAQAQPITMVALGDQSGKLVLVTASMKLHVTGQVAGWKVPLAMDRTGEFVLTPDASGAWKINSYTMTVDRSGAGVDVTTPPATTGRKQ